MKDLYLYNGYWLVEPVLQTKETTLFKDEPEETSVYRVITRSSSHPLSDSNRYVVVDVSGVFKVSVNGEDKYFIHPRSIYASYNE